MSNVIKSSSYYYIVGVRTDDDIMIKLPKVNRFNSEDEARSAFMSDYKDWIDTYGIDKFKIVKETKILSECGVFDLKGNEITGAKN